MSRPFFRSYRVRGSGSASEGKAADAWLPIHSRDYISHSCDEKMIEISRVQMNPGDSARCSACSERFPGERAVSASGARLSPSGDSS